MVSAAQKEKRSNFFFVFFLFRVCYLGFRDGAKKRESFEVDLVVRSSVSLVTKMCNNNKKKLCSS